MADPDKTSPPSTNDTVEFNEQCFLVDHMYELSQLNASIENKYTLITRLKSDVPSTIISKFNQRDHVHAFFNLLPHQHAALVPKIKIFKVHLNEDETTEELVELVFNDSTSNSSIENITKSRFGRGDGVGIKSFEVETQGTNPAEGALVKCVMTLHFQNIEMLVDRTAPPGSNNNYLDLIWRHTKYDYDVDQDGNHIPASRIFNPNYFKIMATVGWAMPTGDLGHDDALIRKALKESTQTIFLSLVQHEIDFQQDGTINLTITYQGAIQGILSSPGLDVLYTGEHESDMIKIQKNRDEIKKSQESVSINEKKLEDVAKRKADIVTVLDDRDGGSIGSHDRIADLATSPQRAGAAQRIKNAQENIKKLKRRNAEATANMRSEKYARIITSLYKVGRIAHIDLTPKQIESMRLDPETRMKEQPVPITENQIYVPDGALGSVSITDIEVTKSTMKAFLVATAKDSTENFKKAKEKLKMGTNIPAKPPENHRINFFFLGDLIEVVAELQDTTRKKGVKLFIPDVRYMLGPFTYVFPRLKDGTRISINLADVPISLKLFEIWFNKNVIRKRRDTFPVKSFIKEITTQLVLAALGDACFKGVGTRKNMIGLQGMVIPGIGQDGKEHRIATGDVNIDSLKPDTFSKIAPHGTGPPRKNWEAYKHYLFMYGAAEAPDHLDPSDVEKDFEEGVYHFLIGADRGLLKTINFSRTDIPSLRPARLTSEDKRESQLRDKYNAELELIGNPFFTPGQKIYINPTISGFGSTKNRNSIARELGLGGYYDVITVRSTISRAGYKTSLDCVWISFGNDETTPPRLNTTDRNASALDISRALQLPKIEAAPPGTKTTGKEPDDDAAYGLTKEYKVESEKDSWLADSAHVTTILAALGIGEEN